MTCNRRVVLVAARAVAFAALLFTLGSCQRPPPPAAPPANLASHGTYGGQGTRAWYAIKGEQIAVLVWCDRDVGIASVGGGPVPLRATIYVAGDRGSIEIECSTADGKTGTVKIDGMTYDLARGAVFLVSTRGERRVAQLERNTSHWKADADGLEVIAKSDPEIGTFVSRAAEVNPP